MRRKHILVIGSNFAGFTAASELKEKLCQQHDVTVISKTDQFLFTPSLIWIPFGLRTRDDITFDVRAPLEQRGIRFRLDEVTRLDLARRSVMTRSGPEQYDYLVIATGPKPNYGAVPGLGPRGYTQSITSLAAAEMARTAYQRFLAAPGPVVVGSVQGAACVIAAYEFLFSMACELRKAGLAAKVPLTYLTGEPCLAHFRAGGFDSATEVAERFLDELQIRAVTGAAVRRILPGEIHLADGQILPFAYAMLMPPFLGVDAVRACDRITTASGFVRVNPYCQSDAYPEVFAAGAAVAIEQSGPPVSPEDMAKLVAHNIAARIAGQEMTALAPLAPSAPPRAHRGSRAPATGL
jgi:sulfide:quinone oxidoreductase